MTASASSRHSSVARRPVRASISMTSRQRGTRWARAAVISLAAAYRRGTSAGGSTGAGMSPWKIGFRPGASGQSHSMIRSKKILIIRRRCRWVFVAMVASCEPVWVTSQSL